MSNKKTRKPRKPARKAVRKPAPPKPARKATRKAAPKPKVIVKRVKAKAQTLTPQEAQGMKVLAQLADSQFCEDGKLSHASGFVKALTDSERAAMIAARARLKKTVGA